MSGRLITPWTGQRVGYFFFYGNIIARGEKNRDTGEKTQIPPKKFTCHFVFTWTTIGNKNSQGGEEGEVWALFMFRVVIGAIFGLATMHRSFFLSHQWQAQLLHSTASSPIVFILALTSGYCSLCQSFIIPGVFRFSLAWNFRLVSLSR